MPKNEDNIFAQLFDSTQSLVALYNPANEKFEQVNKFGLTLFEMQNTDEFISRFQSGKIWPAPPADLSAYLTEIETEVHVNGYLEREMLYQTATGTTFWGLLRIDSLEVKGERYLLIKITNIDHLKKVKASSVQNTRELHAIFNNSSIGIVLADNEGRIVDFNSHAENLFGYSKEEIIKQLVEVLIPSKYHHRHEKDRTAFVQHPQDRVMGAGRDLFARRKDGSEFPVEVSLSHYRNREALFVIAFIVDISIRKKAEIAMLQQKEELEVVSAQVSALNAELESKVEARTNMLKETLMELERSKEELRMALEKEKELGELKSRFVAMASHEFRTPLSTILSSSFLAQEYVAEADTDKRTKHFAKIQNAVHNLTFILEDFLSLEKLEEGLVQVRFQVLTEEDLVAKIEGVAEEMKNIVKKGQRFEISHTALPELITDRKLLGNILINLVSNAIKYSPEHSTIRIGAIAENGQVKIAVADQGIGIPEADQKHLFERFFRASNATTIQGTGLGLHIVSRYLQLIKGAIQMKSEEGKGTTFTIVLDAG